LIFGCLGAAAFFGLVAITAVDAGAAAGGNPVVVLDTSMGPITIELNPAKAPVTVDNFLKYVDSGYYNNLVFHRVMPDFMIQGGGLDENLREKKEGLRPPIKNEAGNGLPNQRGTIAMARTSDPNSATSQFFINHADNTNKLGPGDVDAYGYAVFGKVIAGMEVVDKIADVPTAQRGPHGDVPLKPVFIKSAKRKN
jgi:peptidyl-prolyl cis-trans isomerase A (cyclophilin A)